MEVYRLMLQIRPTEVKAIADLLMQEHDDVEQLAREVIELVDTLRAKRELFIGVAVHPTLGIVQAVGPYATKNQVLKDAPHKLHKYDTQSQGYVALLKDPAILN